MKKTDTAYGKLCIGSKQELFDEALALVEQHRRDSDLTELTWALTGGSTPADFYRYIAENRKLSEELVSSTCWFTSDERMVHLDSDESNFGNASRLLLNPYKIPYEKRYPWPVEHEPRDAARLFNDIWHSHFSDFRCFDVCFLGMGDDCHTASIFPHSPLVSDNRQKFFAYVEVEHKGPRLTITQYGLEKCGLIVVMVTGKNKAYPLNSVFNEIYEPVDRPIQLLRNHASRTVWLVDEDAASKLGEPIHPTPS